MNVFKKAFVNRSNAQARSERKIRFLGEQDGPIEQEIKARWKKILISFPQALRVYLAIVSFGGAQHPQVALCVRSEMGDNARLVEALAEPFRQMFNAATPLDIMFLDEAQEVEVKKVCRAFYEVQ